MTTDQPPPLPQISFQPYLLRSIYEWIADNGFTPYIDVDTTWRGTIVPKKYLEAGNVVLNVSVSAVRNLRIGNDAMEFDTKFGATIFHIYLPIGAIRSIFARENNCGITFAKEMREQKIAFLDGTPLAPQMPKQGDSKTESTETSKPRPQLRVIKSSKKKKS